MKRIKLTPRLSSVASFVKKGSTVADVGTDHGFIPVYLIQNGISPFAIASDINSGPLESAVRTAREYSVSDKISFVCAPGLDGVEERSVDTVIIAGMGGETIVGILDAAPWLKDNKTHIILQPQSKQELLEDFLNSNGYEVNSAKLVKDSGRLYMVLSLKFEGVRKRGSTTFFAEFLKSDILFKEYAEGIIKKLNLRKQGLLSANIKDESELEYIEDTVKYLTSVMEEI